MKGIRHQASGVRRFDNLQFALAAGGTSRGNLQVAISFSPSSVDRLPSTHPCRSGFTLLELLLVLALMAAIAAMVWPAMQRPLATQRLKRAAEQVRMHLIKARTQAISTGETIGFTFQPGKSALKVAAYTNNEALLESVSTMSQGAGQSGTSGQAGPPPAASSGASSVSPAASRPTVEDVLPEGVIFYGGDVSSDTRSDQFLAQERIKGSVDLSWSQPVLFYPDGTALAARVAVVGDRNRAIVIEVRSLTGGARVGNITTVEALRQ
jgi:prepilin-type N-terminal cleavage/methylation domain-containing protein